MKLSSHSSLFAINIFLIVSILNKNIQCATKEPSYGLQGDDWGGTCATGKAQSPINVVTSSTIKTNFTPLSFTNYDQEVSLKILNTAHTIKFTIPPPFDSLPLYVQGGGLEDTFQFLQGHLHWGSKDRKGSEHTLDGYSAPMELHLVHFNTKYGSTANEAIAANKYNSLAVLSVMFDVGEREDNMKLQPFFESITKLKKSGGTTKTKKKINPSSFILDDRYFFRYNGSLTTPKCNEIVVWTLFKDPTMISNKQFNELLKTKNSKMDENSNNYRNVQSLNGRKVLDSSSPDIQKTHIIVFLFAAIFVTLVY